MPPRNGRNASSRNPVQPVPFTKVISLFEKAEKKARKYSDGGGWDVNLDTNLSVRMKCTSPGGRKKEMFLSEIADKIHKKQIILANVSEKLKKLMRIKGVKTKDEFRAWLTNENTQLRPFREMDKSRLPADIVYKMNRVDAIFRLSGRLIRILSELKHWNGTLKGFLIKGHKEKRKESVGQKVEREIGVPQSLVRPEGEGLDKEETKPVADVLELVSGHRFGIGKTKKEKAKK